MEARAARSEAPASREEAAELLREAGEAGAGVRLVGGGTKLAWGGPVGEPDVELFTRGLDRIVSHDAGDLTAVLEAGVSLARAQEAFAGAGQRLALDPPLGDGQTATVGGVVATGDSGPLRSRYGGARDLVVGVTVALPDGTVAKAGGKVIKNVAGYDLAKLLAGSFGTLGLIVEVAVRLHPRPERTITAVGSAADPALLGRGALALSHAPLEHEGLDVRFGVGGGAVMARFGGAAPREQAEAALGVLRAEGLEPTLVEDDGALWDVQRAGQRSASGTVVRVSGLQTQLVAVCRAAARLGARVVGRAPLGLCYVRLEDRSPGEAVAAVGELRRVLHPSPCVVLDAPADVRSEVDVWGIPEGPGLELMRRVRERFDPGGVLNRGI